MAYGHPRATYENALARAYSSLHTAERAAVRDGDEGAAEDCGQLLQEVVRLQTASLKGPLKPYKGQMTFHSVSTYPSVSPVDSEQ